MMAGANEYHITGYGGFAGFGGGGARPGGGMQQNQDNNMGGGFMGGGQSQGGGYGSQTNDFGGGGAGGGGGGGKKSNNQSLRPVSIKQFHEAKQVVPDGPYKLDGAEITNISMVGKIININEQSTTITYTIDDGTGQVIARKWLDDADNTDANAQKRGQVSEGQDVKVFGSVGKPYASKNNATAQDKTMTVYAIRPIGNPDEITLHNLEAQYAHLYYTKGPLHGPNNNMQSGYGGGFNGQQGYGNQAGGYGNYGMPNQQQQGLNNQYTNQGGGPPRTNYDNGLSAVQNKIMDVCRSSPPGGSGTNIAVIVGNLRSHCNEAQVKADIDYLVAEGFLFSTIDDEHYNVCDAGS
ncbi:hypothetical protein SmJEL517_g03291 [Synchytrium microbalum]|uniref:Replication protein A C-terminal domain-containing protein n=1 Tax=Synchytrium microbalum TaxID=1806994 RepID=A0A507C8S6_9FUNG|nr:uncharacterized protein SmJEL517_g03291 [Synchytrium microbalum]TPX33905.1 hypothetical protein SmJEL517_g03291 [Synchytrium microbalum]